MDITDPSILLPDVISQAEFVEIKGRVISALQKVPDSDWTVLEAPVERCLGSLSKVCDCLMASLASLHLILVLFIFQLNDKGLRKVAKAVKRHGVCGAINKL